MNRVEASTIWKLMPNLMLSLTIFQSFQPTTSLTLISFCFFAMKILEFSVRRMLDEMVNQVTFSHIILNFGTFSDY